jgi:hypothetical protein
VTFWYRSGSLGSVPLTNGSGCGSGSGSCSFFPPSRCQKFFFAFSFLMVHLHHFSKIKCHKEKEVPKQLMEGSGSETGQLPYITDPDPESQKTHESYRSGSRCGSGTLLNTLHTHYCALFFTRRSVRYIPD